MTSSQRHFGKKQLGKSFQQGGGYNGNGRFEFSRTVAEKVTEVWNVQPFILVQPYLGFKDVF
jgi:hypothetical protein